MEKFCPVCNKTYSGDETRCSDDQTPLVFTPRQPTAHLIGRTLAGRYQILSLLGTGGMGAVYRASQLSMQREVAIKVLRRDINEDPVAIKRFFREAQSASRLRHANTITIFDFGQDESGLLFIVMELLQGRPLSRAIAADGPFDPLRAAAVIAQVCDSLSEAHRQDIVHRDLKPDNIFLVQQEGSSGEFAKVLDFGIAKSPSDGGTALTAAGQVFGTPAYMCPEVAVGRPATARSDLYALGVILHEMLTGQQPFRADSPMAQLFLHVHEPVPSVREAVEPEVAPVLDEYLARVMAKRPEDRPASAQEMKQELLAALEVYEPTGASGSLRPLGGSGAQRPISGAQRPISGSQRPVSGSRRPLPVQEPGTLVLPEAPAAGDPRSGPRPASGPRRPLSPSQQTLLLPETGENDDSLSDPHPAPPRRRGWLWVLAAAAVLFTGSVLGVLLFWNTHDGQDRPGSAGAGARPPVSASAEPTPASPSTTAGPPTPPEPPAAPRQTLLHLESDPPGAEVLSGGQVVGHTPLDLTAAVQPGARITYELRSPSRQPATYELPLDGDVHEQRVVLEPLPSPPKPAPQVRPRTARPGPPVKPEPRPRSSSGAESIPEL